MDVDKRAVITGSTRGIGFAIASRLARDGYSLVLNYARNDQQAQRARKKLGTAQVILVKADVTDEEQVHRLVDEAISRGPVDLWVNNVGDFLYKPLLETTRTEWDAVLASNLTSAFLCCRAIIPHMRARGTGVIINIGMMHAEVMRAVPNTVPYTIAKAGIVILTKSLAKAEGKYGIRVNAINPGFIAAGDYLPHEKTASIPLGSLGTPDDIAAAVAFLASDEARYITGAIINVHGGVYL